MITVGVQKDVIHNSVLVIFETLVLMLAVSSSSMFVHGVDLSFHMAPEKQMSGWQV